MAIVVFKLGLSALFGLIIGIDRELKKKPLGMKTCMVLAVSSCLLTLVSIQASYDFAKNDHMMMDPLRLAAQIVSGIGFIGAGVILKRNDDVISGLTTAAMIWGASGIGIAVGAGYYWEAASALFFIFLGVDFIPFLLRKWGPDALTSKETHISFLLRDMGRFEDMKAFFSERDMKVRMTKVTELEEGVFKVELRAQVHELSFVTDIFAEMRRLDYIEKLDVKSL